MFVPPPGLFFRVLSFALLLGWAVTPCQADIRTDPKPEGKGGRPIRPPIARAARADAVRGFPVEISLTGLTASTRPMQFIIRRAPKHGRILAEPVPVGKDSAIVRYEGDPASAAQMDSFSFAVKVEGLGSSDEAEVTIRLVDPAPVVEVPGGLDLGRILAGQNIDTGFSLGNKGNAPFRATVPLPEGWAWLAPEGGAFDVAPGESMEAKFRVRMKEAGELDHKLELRPGSVVRILGRVLPPFLAYPSLIRLQWEPGTALRTWRFSIRNNAPDTMSIKLSAPAGVRVPESILVGFAETKEVSVTASGDVSKEMSGKIQMQSGTWAQDIAFEAAVAPARVELSGTGADGSVDFGILPAGEETKASRELIMKNVGGTPALIRWDALRFFNLEGLDTETMLPPMGERKITLRPRIGEPGRLKDELFLRMTGGDRTVPLLAELDPKVARAAMVKGKVLDIQPKTAPGETPGKPTTESGERLKVQVLSRGLMRALPKTDPTLPVIEAVNMIVMEPDRLVFEWPAPGPGTWTYKVMVRMLRNHGRQQAPIPEYDEMDNVKVTSSAAGGRAEVNKLFAEAYWTCCIVAFRDDGVNTKPGPDLKFITPPMPEQRWPWRLLGGLGVLSLMLYIRQKWREDVKWKD